MKTIKRLPALLALLAVAIAPMAGLAGERAYTLAEIREQAASGWHKTYETKWRDVTIDVDIRVPEGDALPVSIAEIRKLEPPADAQEKGWGIRPYDQPGEQTLYNFAVDFLNPAYETQDLEKQCRRGKVHYYQSVAAYRDFEDARAYGIGNDTTLGDMKAQAGRILAALGVEEGAYDLSEPFELIGWSYVDKKTGEPVQKTRMFTNFYGRLNGIPVLQEKSYFNFFLSMIDDTDWGCGFVTPLAERERLAEDTPLAPLDQVIQALESQITTGHIRAVLDMRLGYRLYRDKAEVQAKGNMASSLYAVPMWVVQCIAVKDPNKALEITAKEREGNEDYPEESIQRASRHYKTYVVDARTGHLYEAPSWPYKNVDDEPEYFRQEMLGQ